MKPRVLLDVSLPDFLAEQIEPFCQIVPWSELSESGSGLDSIEGIYTYAHPPVGPDLMDRLPGLKTISNFGVGVDHIDLAAAHDRGLPVGNTPGAVDGATADMTMALLLASARNLVVGDRFARGPNFTSYDPSLWLGAEVHGSRLGIVGMGRIGREVAKRARGFSMEIVYHNRRRDEASEAELGVEYRDLESLLTHSHFVSLNVPLTEETRHLIDRDALRLMRKDAILVNVARGGVVDHDALLEALRNRWIAGAAIDVTEPEPLPRDHPLLELDNLVIAPHLGSATVRTRKSMGRMAADNLKSGLLGLSLPNQVSAHAGP
ncbi:MAG: D-glycerate dehydrogenase [Planctomycetota bacterium]